MFRKGAKIFQGPMRRNKLFEKKSILFKYYTPNLGKDREGLRPGIVPYGSKSERIGPSERLWFTQNQRAYSSRKK